MASPFHIPGSDRSGAAAAPTATASVQHLEQAAQWYATLNDEQVTDADRQAWRAWLAQSSECEAAWAHIENVSRKFAPLRGYGAQSAAAVAASVKAARSTGASRRKALGTLAGALGLGALGWASWRHTPLQQWTLAWRADHHTGTGERRDLVLADGSRVFLNTSTALDVDYRAGQRRLFLLAGEILIQTASDSQQRPFYVDTADGRLRALGTRFSVRQTQTGTRLDVFDGAVEIRSSATGSTQRVMAGQAAVFDARTISALLTASPLREAWVRGSLPADNLPLGELLTELNRYRHGHISVAPEVAGLKVMGIYPADDPDRALDMLEQALPIRVRRSLPWWVTVEAR